MRVASIRSLAVDMLLSLLKVYSPPKGEREAVEILKQYASELGYDELEVDEVGNLIASYGNGDISIAVVGHIDTVPWPIPTSFDGIRLRGRGAVDAKGPLVAAFIGLGLAKDTVDTNKMRVYAIAAVDEEGDSTGARHLVKKSFKAHGIVIAEPSNNNGVVLGYRGSMKIKVVCSGPGGHSSMGTENSACEKLIAIWQKIKEMFPRNSVDTHTPALLRLYCGEDAPISPRYGEATIGIRIALEGGTDTIKKGLDRVIGSVDGCRWELLDYTKPVKVSVNNIVARALIRSLLRNNMRPRILYKYGTSDMNILYPEITENIAAYGPGRSELAHTDREEITVDELIQGVEVYRGFIEELSSTLLNTAYKQ